MNIIIDKREYCIPSNAKEITISQYFEYIKVLETYKDWLTAIQQSEEFQDEDIHKEVSFMADMIHAATNIPKKIIYEKVPASQISKICSHILSEEDKSFDSYCHSFSFVDSTPEERENVRQEIKNTKWYRIHRLFKLHYKLYKLNKPVIFLVAPDLAKQTLSQWIITENLRKNILEATEGMQIGMYSNISKIIAYIVKRPNEDYCEKTAERRIQVFKHLSLDIAHKISNFFLLMFHEYTKTSQIFSKEQTKNSTKNKT